MEWNVSYYLCAKETPQGKFLFKDDTRRIIDGTIFFQIAKDIKEGRLQRISTFKAGLYPAGTAAGKKSVGGKKIEVAADTRKEE